MRATRNARHTVIPVPRSGSAVIYYAPANDLFAAMTSGRFLLSINSSERRARPQVLSDVWAIAARLGIWFFRRARGKVRVYAGRGRARLRHHPRMIVGKELSSRAASPWSAGPVLAIYSSLGCILGNEFHVRCVRKRAGAMTLCCAPRPTPVEIWTAPRWSNNRIKGFSLNEEEITYVEVGADKFTISRKIKFRCHKRLLKKGETFSRVSGL